MTAPFRHAPRLQATGGGPSRRRSRAFFLLRRTAPAEPGSVVVVDERFEDLLDCAATAARGNL